jgi:hypothetical protein
VTADILLREYTSYKTPEWNPRTRRIISVDGEGEDVNGRHAYTLLAAADDRGYQSYVEHDGSIRPRTEHRAANHGLPTKECLEFLLNIPQHRSDLVVAFAFVYDATKILQDLPVEHLTRLLRQEKVQWGNYELTWRPRKWFSVCDTSSRFIDYTGKYQYRRYTKVWDTFAYFQKSFVSALDGSKALFDTNTRTYISEMKSKRNDFEHVNADEIRKYCFMECRSLSILIRDLLVQLDRLGFSLNDYSGPGPIAAKYYTRLNLKQYMPTAHPRMVCGMPKRVAEMSYYGGRFERIVSGPVGNGYSYDIRSAYPAVISTLPCLRHVRFRRTTTFVPGQWGFYKVGSNTTGPWAPFPFRTDKNTSTNLAKLGFRDSFIAGPGSVLYAHGGIRWVGAEEVAVAIAHYGADAIPIYDGWTLERDCNHQPFESSVELSIRALYNFRKQLKKAGDGAEKAVKLLLNSIYGKLAQSIGWKLDRNTPHMLNNPAAYKPPPYQCYVWAAWITSNTRAKLLKALLAAGDGIVSTATDGILATIELPEPEYADSSELGEWEKKPVSNIWIGMPGIYAYDSENDGTAFKTRGFSAKYFPNQYLRDQWAEGNWEVDNISPDDCERYGLSSQPMRAFIPTKQGLRRSDPYESIGEWVVTSKELDMRDRKRIMVLRDGVDPLICHDGGIVTTIPFLLPSELESAPYQPKQTWEDVNDGAYTDMEMLYDDEEDLLTVLSDQ